MKNEMLDSLNRRFSEIEITESLVLATLLDPCFKDKFFSTVIERQNAKELLITKIDENSMTLTANNTEPPEKRARTETAVLKSFQEILDEADTSQSDSITSHKSRSIVDQYLAEPTVPYHGGNAFTWWADNKFRFHSLSDLALRYLSAPPTSVPSERLFLTAGDIYDEKRNRLAPEKAEMLLFIKTNSHLLL